MATLSYYQFWHNGHRVSIGPVANKYEAATYFRDKYGYLPDLNDVVVDTTQLGA